jgi:hypothetical protein
LVSVVFLGCFTLEPEFCGTTEEELCATAAQWVDKTISVMARIDGREIPDLEHYRVATGPFSIILAMASPGVEAGMGMAVSDGYSLLLPRCRRVSSRCMPSTTTPICRPHMT